MSTTTTTEHVAPIDLSLAERHTLSHLLSSFIHDRTWEAVKHADSPQKMAEAAERVRLLSQLESLGLGDEASLPRDDLEAHRAALMAWAEETTATTKEHEELIAACKARPDLEEPERHKEIRRYLGTSVQDHAHACVCESIVGQIDAAEGSPRPPDPGL